MIMKILPTGNRPMLQVSCRYLTVIRHFLLFRFTPLW